ncbi:MULTISPECIES: Hpt domain-containing protein [Pseudomonas]|uniref:Histidine kinase n=2 Tax=Pseudomonadaceae TaxID=135621 RepID=A0A0D0KII1_9PSED|nr:MULTISPECIES: Hpt domain-containing protein [Pseudomonas]KIP96735.1 histidine kinase [Pseudomonas fulva]MCW2292064.1 HPt (histidine-containing phosphotransfer) domain-containing protein [Pseudomonas sp. BIGb0408]NYH73365.1 HPt (histidine-containing phosphotransfer) domain-containing protein [Pseudomonas flavescens]
MSDNHLDRAVLVALQDIMEDEYPVLLDTFVADSDERLRLLQEAERLQDAQAMRHAAHSFKGSCSNMGAKVLAESCRELEELARRGDLTDSAELIGRVEREFAIVRILLKSERQRFSTD